MVLFALLNKNYNVYVQIARLEDIASGSKREYRTIISDDEDDSTKPSSETTDFIRKTNRKRVVLDSDSDDAVRTG